MRLNDYGVDPVERMAGVYAADVQILSDGIAGSGVVSGGVVTSNNNLTVGVTAASYRINNLGYSYAGGTINLASHVHGTLARWVLLELTTSNTLLVNAGTAASAPNKPVPTTNRVVASAIYVVAATTNITTFYILDERALIEDGWTLSEIDFGTIPQRTKTFTITDSRISSGNIIATFCSSGVATGRVGNDAAWDALILAAHAEAGSLSLTATAVPGPVVGKRKIYYRIS